MLPYLLTYLTYLPYLWELAVPLCLLTYLPYLWELAGVLVCNDPAPPAAPTSAPASLQHRIMLTYLLTYLTYLWELAVPLCLLTSHLLTLLMGTGWGRRL